MPNPIRTLALAGCAALLSLPALATPRLNASLAPITKARGEGPYRLAALLAKFDAMEPGAERDKLEREIDTVAGQRYAAVSRLYWHTNLDDAKAAAAKQKQPILHLRMLGRLDEEL